MEYRRYDGFAPRQIDEISELLSKKNIRFKVVVNEEALARLETEWKQSLTSDIPQTGRHFDPHHVSFDILEEDVPLIDGACRRAGFVEKAPEVSEEEEEQLFAHKDYLCLRCDHCQSEPGLCPKHQEPLLEFADWNAARNQGSQESMMKVGYLAVGLLAVLVIAWLLTR